MSTSQAKILYGIVKHSINFTGIPNVEVLLVNWTSGIQSNKYEKKYTKTDNNGNFQFEIDSTQMYGLAFFTKNFLPKKIKSVDIDSIQNINLTECEYSKSLKIYPLKEETITQPNTYIGLKFKSLNYKINYSNTFLIGYDITKKKQCYDAYNSDIYISSKNDTTLDFIKTSEKGGLIPIYSNDSSSHLFFDKNIAPEDGYISSFELTGKEIGFFIKDKKGNYSKLILTSGQYSSSVNDIKNRPVEQEFFIPFDLICQENGTRNLTYCIQKLNLESYLIYDEIY